MKNCYLFPFLLLFTTTIFAQHNTEFGIAAKAGNFTLPKKGLGPQPAGFTHSSGTLSAGFSTGFGLYGQLNMKPRWGLTADLLYTVSSFSIHQNFDYEACFDAYILVENDWTRRYEEHSLMLPLKIHYNLGASAKTVLAVGVAPSFHLSTRKTVSSALTEGDLHSLHDHLMQYQNLAEPAPRLQMLFVASLHQRIGARISLGIEVVGSPRPNDLSIHPLDKESNVFVERSPYSMKSLSASLRYCIFR